MADAMPTPTPKRMRHKKRGTVYEVIDEADLQTEKPLSDYAVVVVYRDPSNGRLWVRPREEFYDGRFEEVPADGQEVTTVGEYAARAIAREKARIEDVPDKQLNRYIEDNWFGEWVLVTNSLRTWRQEMAR